MFPYMAAPAKDSFDDDDPAARQQKIITRILTKNKKQQQDTKQKGRGKTVEATTNAIQLWLYIYVCI